MHEAIPDTIGIVREVLEANHPNAEVKAADPGDCDFRIGALGASVSVTDVNGGQFTDKDRSDILQRVENEVADRTVEYKTNPHSKDMHTFDLVSTE